MDRPDASAPPPRHVALVGLSGTGKSASAPLLAARLGLAVVDVDREVERVAGTSVAELFEGEGESAFRRRESDALHAALDGPPAVIATGGGIVVDAANRAALARSCTVVWLRTDPGVLAERLAGARERRPLLDDDAGTTLRRLAAEREPLYREVADLVVDADGLSVRQVVDLVDAQLDRAGDPTTGGARGARP